MSSSIKPSPSRSGLTKTPIVSSRLPISPISKPLLKPRFRRHFNQWHKSGYETLENESLVNDISLLHPGLLVTECVYNPHMTKLLQQAQQAGCKTIDGYGMLLWQGAEQFTLWTGKDFPLEYVKQVMGFGA